MEAFSAGTLAGAGSFKCDSCGFAIALHERDAVPDCPECGGDRFSRASLFGTPEPVPHQMSVEEPEWLPHARDGLEGDGHYVAFHDGERVRVMALEDGWTRVGRSLSAHVRFDDPTVSRRHALLYHDEEGARVLDDRSLNGVFVNGERVVSQLLADGDEIVIGRYRLRFADRSALGAETAAAPSSTE